MEIEILKENKVIVWRPQSELDDPSHLKDALEEFKKSGMHTVMLDLMEKEWLSSSEIGVVMWIYKELERMGSDLCLLAVSPFVIKTIRVTGIDEIIPVFESRAGALNNIDA